MLLKKIVKTVSLIIIGIIVIYGINRFVTRKVVIEDAESSVIATEKEETQKKKRTRNKARHTS